jgi:hypothetical protein
MSNFQGYGTVTADGSTSGVVCSGYVTLAAALDSGSGTWTWEFKGPDGVWRSIYGGSTGITEQSFTSSHMINAYFGGDVLIRGTASASSAVQWDWQIISNVKNRR